LKELGVHQLACCISRAQQQQQLLLLLVKAMAAGAAAAATGMSHSMWLQLNVLLSLRARPQQMQHSLGSCCFRQQLKWCGCQVLK
jgi:hypothetical protein